MKRVIILLLDSFGVGASHDAKIFGDEGADTFGHIVEYCVAKRSTGPLNIPNLSRFGLLEAASASRGKSLDGMINQIDKTRIQGAYGYAIEQSKGKDTPSGHWELAGLPVQFDWGYFPPEYPSFPDELVNGLIKQGRIPGILGNRHASGTVIIDELGEEHIKTGKPIVYTSADSVFQIAAHEDAFGLERLYDLCQVARQLVDKYKIGRVIARPFLGKPGDFYRTANRRDYSTTPHGKTLLDYLIQAQGHVRALGKIADIYAHCGISETIKGEDNNDLFDKTVNAIQHSKDKTLIFTNFVDFDSKYGHRRNVEGYARALEVFDQRLPEIEKILQHDDLVFITADHGCDPTWPGSDHTREHIPILIFGPRVIPQNIGARQSFADIGQTIADYFNLNPLSAGQSFLSLFVKS